MLTNELLRKCHSCETRPLKVRGTSVKPLNTFESYKRSYTSTDKGKSKLILSTAKGSINSDIDISWLPVASEVYQISPNINDYVLSDIPIVTVDLPNRNMQAFPYEEVSYFDPFFGKMVYQTFLGKPTHIDHQNENPKEAKGVIFDVSMEYVKKYNTWKIRTLSGWDRSKDKALVSSILAGVRDEYSMGASVTAFICSVCFKRVEARKCEHMVKGMGSLVNTGRRTHGADHVKDKLIYQLCCGVNYIELSSVVNPADMTAATDKLWV